MSQNTSVETREIGGPPASADDNLLKDDPLESLARRLAGTYSATRPHEGGPLLLARLKRQDDVLAAAYRHFSSVGDEAIPSYAGEWLLDNYFVIQQVIREIRQDMPLTYYRELPKLTGTEWEGHPRIYAVAHEIIEHCRCQIDIGQSAEILRLFQREVPLTMGELWAFPTMLRLGLLDTLADILSRLIAPTPPDGQITAITDEGLVGPAISSLRLMAARDWKTFFESVSLVERILRGDPSGTYARMDFVTRNRYREVIEHLARWSNRGEEEVARRAVEVSADAPSGTRESHVGYYLIGDGARQLERSLGYRAPLAHALRRWMLDHPAATYLTSVAVVTLLALLLPVGIAAVTGGGVGRILLAALLSLIPAVTVAVSVVNWAVTTNVPPRLLPRFDFEDGIPEQFRTMVVVPALLTSTEEIESQIQLLELHFLRNSDPSLRFALLTDFTDAPAREMPDDAALVERAQAGIAALNVKYAQDVAPFYLFHREREWNAAEGVWMGWERKRGKLVEFNRLLRGGETTFTVQVGDVSVLPQIKFVITLDADTVLPEQSAHRMIATLAHPLNRAEVDPQTRKVVKGYGILQPRTEAKVTGANQTPFAQVFSGDVGLDLYTSAVSDVYQDLFAEAVYVGKGIYDVDVFEACLAGRIPENALLSHDLFEGLFARVALVTDITLLEEYPASYLAQAHRLHRWVRGDWQLLPWLLPRVPTGDGTRVRNPLPLSHRWKIIDNMRRSLAAPSVMLLLVAGLLGWLGAPWLWMLLALGTFGFPVLMAAFNALRLRTRESMLGDSLRTHHTDLLRWLLAVFFLPYEAALNLDAIIVTVRRVFFTRKHMLQWTTAAQAARAFSGRLKGWTAAWKQMSAAPLMTTGIGLLLALVNPSTFLMALPLLTVWFLSPQIAYRISRPSVRAEAALSPDQQTALKLLARQTWLYFEYTVGPEDHWLPPDNIQETPRITAHRTSPTNIGLMLLSTLAAYDLGYIGILELIARLQATFETIDKLEHFRGHLLNWFNTETLEPLAPRYVSTVDSGNWAACLLILKQACLSFSNVAAVRRQRWRGLLDTLNLFSESVEQIRRDSPQAPVEPLRVYMDSVRRRVRTVPLALDQWDALILWLNDEAWTEISRLIVGIVEAGSSVLNAEMISRLRLTSERLNHHLMSMQRDMELLLPWLTPMRALPMLLRLSDSYPLLAAAWRAFLDELPVTPRLHELEDICETLDARLREIETLLLTTGYGSIEQTREAQAWCENLRSRLDVTRMQVKALLAGYEDLASQAESRFKAMDFTFLYSTERKVFHIGYNVTSDRLDSNYYDLLASEARIASLLAIAKRDVPQRHWLHLARPVTRINGSRVLLSWSGTMFEYLMPVLFIQNYDSTFLTHSARIAVDYHIDYGREKNMPWGISESAYYAVDAGMVYQYRAFGVPGLGFKRGLSEDLVVTPYASLLALPVYPQEVRRNMDHLDEIGMRGLFGYYEAVDFTTARLPLRQQYAIVRAYMAHHQGMILVSVANYLLHDRMVERFHADPRIQSVALLLQEKVPEQAPVEEPHPNLGLARTSQQAPVTLTPWRMPDETEGPQVHVLSNDRLVTVISSSGGGYTQWKGLALTRWEPDSTLDSWGHWIYLQDQDTGALWSAGHQPTGVVPDSEEITFHPHQVVIQRRKHDITLNMQVTVSAEDDVEIRRITLTNHSDRARSLRLTSYAEVVLASLPERHPAFNKLFIESEFAAGSNMLLFHRRPRSADEEPVYLGHLLLTGPGLTPNHLYEADRRAFIGRGRTVRAPAALDTGGDGPTRTIGFTLDPIMSLAQDIALEPYARVEVAVMTLAARSREAAAALAERYRAWPVIERAFDTARRQNEMALRQLDLGTPELAQFQQVLSLLLYPGMGMRAASDTLRANAQGQSGLWAFGVSGDAPILLVRVSDAAELALVQDALQAHAYWRNQQITVELVIMNLTGSSYAPELTNQIHRMITRTNNGTWLNRRGGIFLTYADQISQASYDLLLTAARVVLDGGHGPLAEQVAIARTRPLPLPAFSPSQPDGSAEPTEPVARPDGLAFDNSFGGFSPDGREYVIYLEPGQWTPAPWVNVIANEGFGFIVSEAGAGHTWAVNSSENRLTPWRNDPVADAPGEAVYLRDEETAEVWSPTPLPSRADAPYLIRHGAGYSTFEHASHGLKQHLTLFAAPDAPVKIVKLRLENTWNRPRRITATYYVEWVLGVMRGAMQQFVVPEYDHASGSLLARNAYNAEFGERVAFVTASKPAHSLTTDRTEFLGRKGDIRKSAALERIGLASTVDAGLDPCAAIQLHVDLPVGGSEEVYFLLGQGTSHDDALQIATRFKDPAQVEEAWQGVTRFWDGILGTITVETPDLAMDVMLNRWLLYQALSCRIWGRSALYQSGGAYGYRDQLQDVLALFWSAPHIAREHILRAARHQFEEGDVLHWWHPPSGRGVRTRCSDDLLWLPYITAQYVEATGDAAILDEEVPFLRGEPLKPSEEERYALYEPTAESYPLYDHCLRAIRRGSTEGLHGLPLMGTGDWNDGMNRVGVHGRGESVWVGWFLCDILNRFTPLAEVRGDDETAAAFRQQLDRLKDALETHAWDGAWYRRAYYDDGTPLGSSQNMECEIDSLGQTWAVLSGAGDPDRVAQGMNAVNERLIRRDDRIILLFTPPFDKTRRDPGYIKGYAPGIRENGGQYTHAALWTIWAFAKMGDGDTAAELFRMINPVLHAGTPEQTQQYKTEPYVIAADVYGIAPHTGRGGWTWYTGSSSWMYRTGIEAILGLRRHGDKLTIDPRIPSEWDEYRITYRDGETAYAVHVRNPQHVNSGVAEVKLDGQPLPDNAIPLTRDGGTHQVEVVLGVS